MIRMTTKELADLQQAQRSLEQTLITLDQIGAGIAAIHVDAAIEQIKKNLLFAHADSEIFDLEALFVPEQNQ